MNLLVLVGSLRAGSFNSRLAEVAVAAAQEADPSLVVNRWTRLGDLPHYSEDLDTADGAPALADELRRDVLAADAILIATPEFNGSLPSALKNAIDWASRPREDAPIAGKRVAVIGTSAAPFGSQWAREDAVRTLKIAGAAPLETTVGVGSSYVAFADGAVLDAEVTESIRSLMAELVAVPQTV